MFWNGLETNGQGAGTGRGSTRIARNLAFGALALALAASASASPAAAAKASKPCTAPTKVVSSIRVSGLGCRSADQIIAAVQSGKHKPHGFVCHTRGSSTALSVTCVKGRLRILYNSALRAPSPPPTPQPSPPPTPAPPPAPAHTEPAPSPNPPAPSHQLALSVDSVSRSTETHSGEQFLAIDISLTDKPMEIDERLAVFLVPPGQSCEGATQSFGVVGDEPVEFLPKGTTEGSTSFSVETPAYPWATFSPYATACAEIYRVAPQSILITASAAIPPH